MGIGLDYAASRHELDTQFAAILDEDPTDTVPEIRTSSIAAIEMLFASDTQSFREVLVGCCLAKIGDTRIDIRLPYINQSDVAYNGRTLDEKVVNPFLKEHEIPSSKGPFLSTFRRNVGFSPETGRGLRDKKAFTALLSVLDDLQVLQADDARLILRHALHAFIKLREKSQIRLARINRLSLDQHSQLVAELLKIKSGGLMPVILSVAAFRSLSLTYGLGWSVDFQGINVADAASGAGGDITISREGTVLIAVEVTEREIDKARVRSTFSSKISPNALSDYLFIHSSTPPSDDAKTAAMAYFAQGHDINFISIEDWINTLLSFIGTSGRQTFTAQIINLLSLPDVPAKLRVAWNALVPKIVPV